jgi:hypothetical protein
MVPARFHDELIATANELVNAINCPPPPAPPEQKKEKKDKGGEEGDD